ncbi:MotA/TolQ/ExbB proton channel family protein [Opitutaceae bacterium]|jgi:biopolymer transport protein ExbB|nr:MotA/TolQ/ExbB proton channel family protein [Opitutaceae bacterium]MDB4473442.1 MotA/TolQ/ExbB proton channel family protein [Opitutaceae bacterium]
MTSLSLPIAFLMGLSPMEFFIHGGYIMWPIIVLSFVIMTVVIERVIFTIRESANRDRDSVEKLLERVEAGDFEGAINIGKKSKDFLARILVYSLTHRDTSMANAFARASNQEMQRYNQGMPTLDTIVTAAPYVGLLGTVTGMMATFAALGEGGDIGANAGAITGGVGEALIATACGLAIAIFGLFPFNYMNAKIAQAKHDISDASNALELIMSKSESNTAA